MTAGIVYVFAVFDFQHENAFRARVGWPQLSWRWYCLRGGIAVVAVSAACYAWIMFAA